MEDVQTAFPPIFLYMRYYSKPPLISIQTHGKNYICNHPVYSKCTLFKIENRGLAVIQQRYDKRMKHTYWTQIDGWIANALWEHPKFQLYLDEHAKIKDNGLYPTVTVRQVMWALRMKPLKRERWETVFDRKDI